MSFLERVIKLRLTPKKLESISQRIADPKQILSERAGGVTTTAKQVRVQKVVKINPTFGKMADLPLFSTILFCLGQLSNKICLSVAASLGMGSESHDHNATLLRGLWSLWMSMVHLKRQPVWIIRTPRHALQLCFQWSEREKSKW